MSAPTFSDATLTRDSQRFVGSLPFRRNGLNSYVLCPGLPLTMLNNTSSDFELTIRQQPERARVAGGKEKGMPPRSTCVLSLHSSFLLGQLGGPWILTQSLRCAERKPVDPPPIVQLRVREEGTYLAQYVIPDLVASFRRTPSILTKRDRHYLQSPYYFMCCSLWDPTEDQAVPVPPSTALAGTLVSSLHRLKDVDNNGKDSRDLYTVDLES